jgi:hypothetical protein
MEQSPSWEADSHSASQIHCLLWNPKVHYWVHQDPVTGPCPDLDASSPHILPYFHKILSTMYGWESGYYKNNNKFKHCIYLRTVFELIIVGFIIARFCAAPYIVLPSSSTFSEWSLPFKFFEPKYQYVLFICVMHAVGPTHLIFYFIILYSPNYIFISCTCYRNRRVQFELDVQLGTILYRYEPNLDSGDRGFIQKFPDWPHGAKTANGTALCH